MLRPDTKRNINLKQVRVDRVMNTQLCNRNKLGKVLGPSRPKRMLPCKPLRVLVTDLSAIHPHETNLALA